MVSRNTLLSSFTFYLSAAIFFVPYLFLSIDIFSPTSPINSKRPTPTGALSAPPKGQIYTHHFYTISSLRFANDNEFYYLCTHIDVVKDIRLNNIL